MPRLAAVETKLRWANQQLIDFAPNVGAALRKHGAATRLALKAETNIPKSPDETDTRTWHRIVAYIAEMPAVEDSIGLALGGVVGQYRGCLDYLAWALVPAATKARVGASGQRNIQFPMARKAKLFWSGVKSRLPDVPCSYLRVIESYQPYHDTVRGRAMRLLNNLSIVDKHRVIVLPVTSPRHADIELRVKDAVLIRSESLFEEVTVVRQGAELAQWIVASDSPSMAIEMDFKGEIANDLCLPRSIARPFAGTSIILVRDALDEIAIQCEQLLEEIRSTP